MSSGKHKQFTPHWISCCNFFQPTKKKRMDTGRGIQEPCKQIWLITYGSGCQSITHEILSECGLIADECYTVTWRESKYTLLHLSKENRTRRTSIQKVMIKLHQGYGIIQIEIFGFDSTACNSKHTTDFIDMHPGFKQMIKMLNSPGEELEWWMANGNINTNRKGLLWKYKETTTPTLMSRSQLIRHVIEWKPLADEHQELKNHIAVLTDRLHETENAHRAACAAYDQERKFSDDLMKQMTAKIKECCELQMTIIRLRSEKDSS